MYIFRPAAYFLQSRYLQSCWHIFM